MPLIPGLRVGRAIPTCAVAYAGRVAAKCERTRASPPERVEVEADLHVEVILSSANQHLCVPRFQRWLSFGVFAAADHDRIGKRAIEAAGLVDRNVRGAGWNEERAFDDPLNSAGRMERPAECAKLSRSFWLDVAAIQLRGPQHGNAAATDSMFGGGSARISCQSDNARRLKPIHLSSSLLHVVAPPKNPDRM
jgi:hypothetical protein